MTWKFVLCIFIPTLILIKGKKKYLKYVMYVIVGTNGILENSFKLSQSAVETWWPNEYGKQSMYLLNVEFTGSHEISTKLTQVAFRCQMTTLYQVSKWCQQTVH